MKHDQILDLQSNGNKNLLFYLKIHNKHNERKKFFFTLLSIIILF